MTRGLGGYEREINRNNLHRSHCVRVHHLPFLGDYSRLTMTTTNQPGTDALDSRIERLYSGRLDKGHTQGRAVSYCLKEVGGTAADIRAALARRGILVQDGRRSGVTKRWKKAPAEPSPVHPPEPIPRPNAEAKPSPVAVRRPYSDEGGCVMAEPRDLLASMPGYGKPCRYIHPADLMRRP